MQKYAVLISCMFLRLNKQIDLKEEKKKLSQMHILKIYAKLQTFVFLTRDYAEQGLSLRSDNAHQRNTDKLIQY